MTWLKDGLKSSTATFKLIVNSVPITNFPLLFDFAATDRWEGYGAQRAELLDSIVQNAVTGVLFVSGDFHLGASAAVEPSGNWSVLHEVLMGPGDQSANPLWSTLPSPQFDFKTGTSNVTLFEADPNAVPPTIKVTFLDGAGATLFEKTYAF
jgi:alkaline phosphatase D